MISKLFGAFPYIDSESILIRKMVESDVDALLEICHNENVYRYTPNFLYQKSKSELITAIKNLGGRDFAKKKWMIAGVCLPSNPNRVIGTAEIFNCNQEVNMAEIGYRINESYWRQGIGTSVICAMVHYLFGEIGVNRIQATVMPENVNSSKALLKNGFTREGLLRQAHYWAGKGVVDLEMYSLLQTDTR